MPIEKEKNIPVPTADGSRVDPLFQLFEHHLLTRSYEDSGKFTKELAADYLAYIDSTQAHVPFESRKQVVEDLEAEAHEMLVKKMYGCMRAQDYMDFGRVMTVKPTEAPIVKVRKEKRTSTRT